MMRITSYRSKTRPKIMLLFLTIFLQEAVNESLAQRLGADGVIIRDYNETEHFLAKESQGHNVYLDPDKTNMMIYQEVQKRSPR